MRPTGSPDGIASRLSEVDSLLEEMQGLFDELNSRKPVPDQTIRERSAELDDLLEEVPEVSPEYAAEFVKSYVTAPGK